MKGLTAWNKITGIKAIRLAETNKLNRDEWLNIRRTGIGGSDIAAIAGVNPFSSAINVFLSKTGRYDIKSNDKMRWGNLLEPAVADEYSVTENVKVNKIKAILQHPIKKHFLANIDRLIIKNGHELSENIPSHNFLINKGNGILEVKTTSWPKAWEGDTIPDMYMCQVQWYMHITGLKWSQFAVLISGNDFIKSDPIMYNEKFANDLDYLANKFWHDNVLKDKVPDVDHNPATRDSMQLLYSDINDKSISIPEDLNPLIEKRLELNNNINIAENQKKAIDSKILSIIKNNKFGFTSKFKVSRISRNSSSINKALLKNDFPDIYKSCLTSNQSIYPLYKKLK